MKTQLWSIKKVHKSDLSLYGFLSQSGRRWYNLNSKHRIGRWEEKYVDFFIKDLQDEKDFYYFKVMA
jgi:hypothetical protein